MPIHFLGYRPRRGAGTVPLIAVNLLAFLALYLVLRNPRPDPAGTPNSPESPAAAASQATSEPAPLPSADAPADPMATARIAALAALTAAPDWSQLDRFQASITREKFEALLSTVYSVDDSWKTFIEIIPTGARVATGAPAPDDFYFLAFSPTENSLQVPRNWRSTAELGPAPANRPLEGIKIAIDPGHIGGEWARMEERWFVIGDDSPVREGNMSLRVAKLLVPRLTALGASVSLVREKNQPVTSLRPPDLESLSEPLPVSGNTAGSLQRMAGQLFYRTAEIHARGDLVNDHLKPDLVLCLHFNAEAWGDPREPALVERSHFHLLVNGAYTADEIRLPDQRHALLSKLLLRTHEEETAIAKTVGEDFITLTGLSTFIYPSDSKTSLPVENIPFLWARNLLANRLYHCPVIFLEPYVMNSRGDYARIQAGDFDGVRTIDGIPRISIFREYADALTAGLARYFAENRPPAAR